MRVALLGFGLIGGSIARALHGDRDGGWSVAAWTPNGMAPRVAVDAGIIELAAAIAGRRPRTAPTSSCSRRRRSACLDLVRELGGALRESLPAEAVVTDVASTKARDRGRGREHAACGSSADTRWRGARRPASRRPMPACSAGGHGSSSRRT